MATSTLILTTGRLQDKGHFQGHFTMTNQAIRKTVTNRMHLLRALPPGRGRKSTQAEALLSSPAIAAVRRTVAKG